MHKANTLPAQHYLLPAAALATFQLFHPAMFLSFSAVLLQVVFGLTLTLRPSGVHSTPSLLFTCPSQFHHLLCTSQLMSLISAISSTLLYVVLCCHLMLSILLRHWKLFNFLSSVFVIFHVSQPYSRTSRTKVLNSHILVLLPIPLAAHTFHSLWNAAHAFCSLFLISIIAYLFFSLQKLHNIISKRIVYLELILNCGVTYKLF